MTVVGGGRIGRLRAVLLVGMGHDVELVDPELDPRAESLPVHRDVASAPDGPAIWIVATPTAAHLRTIRDIVAREPSAAVLVEKPICSPEDLPALRALLAEHPSLVLEVASQYHDSIAIRALGHEARIRPSHALSVSFVKDRRPDEARGRFTDRVAGVLGYEWPHIYAIARSLGVTGDDLRDTSPSRSSLDVLAPDGHLVEARYATTCASGRAVMLHSRITGASGLVPADGWGGDGCDPANHRVVQLDDGRERITLWLSPSYASATTFPRGRTALLVHEGPGGDRVRTIPDDPLRISMRDSLLRLVTRRPRRIDIDLDMIEHTDLLLELGTPAARQRGRSHALA
ncbi:hypothetical protein DZF92_07735 [Clavibacter michiganensis subsp. insidiosus]|uniref:Uncharacterized protein n=1 Tax=Clavibacter michiganensis subsp. insidiosus TaxID=33014 RepID=A0A399SN17_9MICO|nr:hypothetical protein B5P21_13335 [Clavibacter michiganensis subsp. insidiosus]RII87212.1 hypothetical protein DZF92_07735 [Clavibacter michiganensis subsp. insidiosus]RIJ44229.1 hypothetical protein DZF93_03630 [Clavibacter michiganensis subsp. insidiosus]RMC84253.1 hypothetical protein CmiCFBP2404_12295 [Clavibacter michiganensis subsp. insidiosus]